MFIILFTIQSNPIDNLTKDDILESTKRSFSDIIPFLPVNPDNLTIPDYILKSIGFVFFGLFFISLRRNLERKFRHWYKDN